MGTVLCVWTQEEVRSVIRFLWAKGTAPIEIYRFGKWISCLDKCFNREGDYVEK